MFITKSNLVFDYNTFHSEHLLLLILNIIMEFPTTKSSLKSQIKFSNETHEKYFNCVKNDHLLDFSNYTLRVDEIKYISDKLPLLKNIENVNYSSIYIIYTYIFYYIRSELYNSDVKLYL